MSCGRRRSGGLVGRSLLAFCLIAPCASGYAAEGPPRFHVRAPAGALTFVVYGDTRFTERSHVANETARRALVAGIAGEKPAAILIGGDLVYQGSDPEDYATYRNETAEWARQKIPVFPALGNHEFHDCPRDDPRACLDNWWSTFDELRPYRWYSVAIGDSLLALILDSDSSLRPGSEQRSWLEKEVSDADGDKRVRFILVMLHYPPVRDPIFPRGKDEAEVQRYLSARAPGLRARVIVVGSHVHNYERFNLDGVVTYLVSGGGGAKPVPDFRAASEQSRLTTSVNFHYLRFTLQGERLTGTMVRYEASDGASERWSEPDRFEVAAK